MSDEEMENTESKKSEKAVKLPYFHRTLSPEDTALIGDIRPKPITPANEAASSSGKLTEGSAWNKANTWEEKECSSWAKEKIISIFSSQIEIDSSKHPFTSIILKKIEKLDGHANVTHSRGKARFIYEYSFNLKIKVTRKEKTWEGTVSIADVINDQLDDLELEFSWDEPKPSGSEFSELKSALISSKLVKKEIQGKLRVFDEEFKRLN